MKAQTDDPRENLRRASQPRDVKTMRSRRRIVIAGWALLLIFVAVVAWSGGIQINARLYQAAYACGFVGFVLLIRVVAWRSDVTGVGRWGWWLLGCILIRVALIGTQPSDDLYRCVWEGRVHHVHELYGGNVGGIGHRRSVDRLPGQRVHNPLSWGHRFN